MKVLRADSIQRAGIRGALKNPYYALFMKPGFGKTLIAINTIRERYLEYDCNRVLIIVPKSIMYNWELEIKQNIGMKPNQYNLVVLNRSSKLNHKDLEEAYLDDISLQNKEAVQAHFNDTRSTKTELLNGYKPQLTIVLANYEKCLAMYNEFRVMKFDSLIVDESHKLRNNNKTSRSVKSLSKAYKSRLLMTGTPIVNGWEDLFMQYSIMDPTILGEKFPEFRNEYCVMGGFMGKQIVDYKNINELQAIMDKTSYIVGDESYLNLPKATQHIVTSDLNINAKKVYKELEEEMLVELDVVKDNLSRRKLKTTLKEYSIPYKPKDDYLTLLLKAQEVLNVSSCDIVLTKLLRLQQVTGGHLTMDGGNLVKFETEKVDQVLEIIEANKHTGPIVIFAQFVAEIERLESTLIENGYQVGNYRNTKTRDKVYQQFLDGELDVIILQTSSGSVGLNLQKSCTLIFYSQTFKADDVLQAIHRVKRRGQTQPMNIYHLLTLESVDFHIHEVVKKKWKLLEKIF